MIATWCPACGPGVGVDEDGCCLACGSTATGAGAEAAIKASTDLQTEKAEHLATCKRWFAISDEQKRRIARARRLMRAARKAPATRFNDFDAAYDALDWRKR